MPDDPRRALIYCRQSVTESEEESGSLAFQEREARLWCQRHGVVVIEPPIVDADQRGWDPLRPGIRELLDRTEREKPDVVVVYALSRFARDYVLQETIYRQLAERGASLASVHEPHAEDDLVRGIIGVVSQAERKRMGHFLRSSFAERARKGLPHGRVPFGFRKGEDGRLEPDPDDAPDVLRMVEQAEAGWSLRRIALGLRERRTDGRNWEPHAVRIVLQSPAIMGTIRTGEVTTPGAHPPIIDAARWERLQAWLDTRRPVRDKSAASWLEGLLYCGCGAPMYLVDQRWPQFRCAARHTFQARYPPCTHTPRTIMQAKAERLVAAAFVTAMEDVVPWEDVLADATERYQRDDTTALERKRLQRRRTQLAAERERLLTLYRRGTLDVERWEAEDDALGSSLRDVDDALGALPTPPDSDALRATGDALAGMAAGDLVRDAPEGIRQALYEFGATVVLTPGGPVIRWPPDVASFVRD